MILVTGGTGFIGKHLLLHLVENQENVRAIYRNKSSLGKAHLFFSSHNKADLFKKIEWVEADILDIPSLENIFEGVDFVYHCAALVSFDVDREEQIRKTNIEGTANVVNLCLVSNIKKLIYFSSIAALGDSTESQPIITEETEWNPEKIHSDYAISKHGAEMEIWRGQQEGLNVIVLNIGVVMANDKDFLLSLRKKGMRFYPQGATGFIAVDDVVEVAMQLMKSEIVNESFVLIEDNYSFQEIIAVIEKRLSLSPSKIRLTPLMLAFLWRMDWFLSTFFFKKRTLSQAVSKMLSSKNQYGNKKITTTLDMRFKNVKAYIGEG